MKTDNSTNMVISLMIVGILIIPVVSLNYVENNTKDEILSNLGKYEYVFVEVLNVNATSITSHLNSVPITVYGNSTNAENVALFYSTVVENHYEVYYGHNITYVGNDSYNLNWENTTFDDVYIPLDITTHELAKLSYIKMYSNVTGYICFWKGIGDDINYLAASAEMVKIDDNTYIILIDITTKIELLNSPNENIFINYYQEPVSTFSVKKPLDLNNTLYVIDDMTQYYIILTGSIALSAFTLMFMTETFDIVIDHVKRKKRRNKKL